MSAWLDVPIDLVLEPNYPGASQIQNKSPAGLPYWSPSLPVKSEFWAILWNLALPPKRSTLFRPSQFLCHFFGSFITNKSTVACQKILMVYESCKTAPFSLAGLGFGDWVDLCVRESGGGGGGCWLILECTARETVSRFSHSLIPNNREALLGHNQNKKQTQQKANRPWIVGLALGNFCAN